MGETKDYPRKYWWVVIVALPIVLGLIAVVPGLMSKAGGGAPSSV
jgi:ABC-type Na+ efflux pump permease subunit